MRHRCRPEDVRIDAARPSQRGGVITTLGIAPVRLYQRLVSPLLPASCKYHPSCSQYAIDALRRYGILRGSVLAAWRLLRCNPWSHGGVDRVEQQRIFT